ncbi:MAG: ABC transporter permease YtrF precursor [Firmicutes bacterium ADurb.Bin182]|nr:MAG: ABC transporter permease YtrF precursor [Firmicutes bacterium ADurb.Bin182]
MRILDQLAMAFMNLWRRKLRAVLTVLGMVIGTASIVVMISLGIGINEAQIKNFEQFGSLTMIEVSSWKYTETRDGMGTSTETELNDKSVEAFRKIPGVKAVMPRIETWGFIKSGQYVTDVSILGVDLDVAEEFGFELSDGRLPNPHTGKNYEIVFAGHVMNNFYNPKTGKQAMDPMTGISKVTLDRSRFQLTFDSSNIYDNGGFMGKPMPMPVGGGYSEDPSQPQPKGKFYKVTPVGTMSEGNNYSWYSLMDINALKKLAKENKNIMNLDTEKYYQVMVKCNDIDDVAAVKKQIDDMGYGTYSLQDALEMAKKSSQQLQLLLGAIGGVALLVAAIGIMNTMMMSIYERTKEIGIIKVLGCRMGNIATLFLTEAAYIGFFGGAIGLGISYGLSALLNGFLMAGSGMMSVIPAYLAVFAVVFSVGVALVSGMYPAVKAMRLSALSAIRSE